MTERNLSEVVTAVLVELPEWEAIAALGVEIYLVGGSVRDAALEGSLPNELDLVTTAPTAHVAQELAERLGGETTLFETFDTATLRTDRIVIDIARARKERYARPGALPEIEPVDSIEEDLRRRDFSVNTLALRVDGDERTLLETPGAEADLKNRKLRVLHDRSFLDDPTRVFRLCRYAARLGFEPDARTEELLRSALADGALATLSDGRLGTELLLLAQEPTAVDAVTWLERLGVLDALELQFERDKALAALELATRGERRDLILLALIAAAHPDLPSWLDQLELPASDRDLVLRTVSMAPGLRVGLEKTDRPSEILEVVNNAPREAVAVAGGDGAKRWLEELSQVQLEISGDDLVAAGATEGPSIGEALAVTHRRKLDGELSGKEQELASALSYINGADDE